MVCPITWGNHKESRPTYLTAYLSIYPASWKSFDILALHKSDYYYFYYYLMTSVSTAVFQVYLDQLVPCQLYFSTYQRHTQGNTTGFISPRLHLTPDAEYVAILVNVNMWL